MNENYDVVVVGGGAAGLNGALMLVRSRRSVLVLDSGTPRNAPAAGVHGLLGHDGIPPAELYAKGRAEVRSYGGEIEDAEVVGAERAGDGFVVRLRDGRTVRARRLLVTTGLVDDLPDIPGVREQWGSGVIHCPYCHGWEVRDRPIGVLAIGPMATHQALLFSQLSDDVILFGHTNPPSPEQAAQLAKRRVRVVSGEVTEVVVEGGAIVGVRAGGTVVPREVVAIGAPMRARVGFLESLGLKTVPHASGMGEHVPVDPMGRTEVPGVWAAGNVADLAAQVGSAASAGAMAGAQINADLIMTSL
ncbi:oxidoreductase [Virgisporangium aliadipatigenens]|uniref:Oxidoreductase n=1 Tax=Virgisporangium aliadipatigenens TaxID=741659 RepID=A0A8J4DNT1_9ACTN|nr:NAD(P)/FAD-dependent oxidoreductase [Virgisporangium aliadipatigenens]GIJ44126.1 oxidoreductase [Virgisporangium aliadipatigenens]